MADPAPDCHEVDTWLPTLKTSLCWFVSTNFAFFHRRLDILDDLPDGDPQERAFLKAVYTYYSGNAATSSDVYRDTIETPRQKLPAVPIPKTISGAVTNPFQVNRTDGAQQDVNDYLRWILEKLDLNTIEMISIDPDPSYNLHHVCWDIWIRKLANTTRNQPDLFRDTTERIVVSSGGNWGDTPVRILLSAYETVTFPIKSPLVEADADGNEYTLQYAPFELTSIIDGRPGHFNSAVKCGDGRWLYYRGGLGKSGPLTQYNKADATNQFIFPSIGELLQKYPILVEHAVILIYDRAGENYDAP